MERATLSGARIRRSLPQLRLDRAVAAVAWWRAFLPANADIDFPFDQPGSCAVFCFTPVHHIGVWLRAGG